MNEGIAPDGPMSGVQSATVSRESARYTLAGNLKLGLAQPPHDHQFARVAARTERDPRVPFWGTKRFRNNWSP